MGLTHRIGRLEAAIAATGRAGRWPGGVRAAWAAVGGPLRDVLAAAEADAALDPTAPAAPGWAEPTCGDLAAFLRAEADVLGRHDPAVLYHHPVIYLRALLGLIEAFSAPPPAPGWPCPTAWLELQFSRLAWSAPGAGTGPTWCAEYHRLNGLLAERRAAEFAGSPNGPGGSA